MTNSKLSPEELLPIITSIVADALALDIEEVHPESTLLDDLEAESIDLLDILFKIERQLGVKIEASDLADHVQGGMTDEEFGDENQFVSERGFAHLVCIMPQIDVEALRGKLRGTKVMSLFTVANLVALVNSRNVSVDA